MTTLKQLIKQNKAGLTVYYPDCIHSRLWGNLDHKIVEATGLQVGFRQWIYHDIATVSHFYGGEKDHELSIEERTRRLETTPLEQVTGVHLFTRLLFYGPSLLTIWHGDDTIEKLLKLKGKTHPAKAESGTVRGGFWCDNASCNLMHSSDDDAEMIRELTSLDMHDLLDSPPVYGKLTYPPVQIDKYVAHSGIIMMCDVVNRVVMALDDVEPLDYTLPESGNARETMHLLTPLLKGAAQTLPAAMAEFIHAYFAGDLIAVTAHMARLPLTTWEQFVIQAGTLSREEWDQIEGE